MKNSIEHFPEHVQQELTELRKIILKELPSTCMIILYGSYARDSYVTWDEKDDFGVHTTFQSDLDILVVTERGEPWKQETKLRDRLNKRYVKMHALERPHPTAQAIVENITMLNKSLEQKQYFYTDVVKDGKILYDNNKCLLSGPRELSFQEIKEIAQNEFDEWYPFATGSLKHGYYDREDEQYKLGAFELHQACERFYYCLMLVFIHYKPKCHNLVNLGGMTKSISRELSDVFLIHTPEERVAYDLLCRAYIEARYNKAYQVNEQEYELMLTWVERMKEVVFKLCTDQLALYGEKAREEEILSAKPMAADALLPYRKKEE